MRPTTERVREAIFSVLGLEVDGARVLDLFAGSGAFGFEALSRGATSAVFVERNRDATDSLYGVTRSLGVGDAVVILNMGVGRAVRELRASAGRFEIIFLDPPYGTDWLSTVVAVPGFLELMETGGLIIVEGGAAVAEADIPTGLRKRFSRKYGGAVVEMFEQ